MRGRRGRRLSPVRRRRADRVRGRLLLVALAVALLACPSAQAAAGGKEPSQTKTDKESSTPKGAKSLGKPAVVKRGLETILQDDGLFLFRPVAEIEAAVARAKALGIDTIRITAGWSSLTRAADKAAKPAGFDARDPGSYEQARWRALDAAIRAIRGGGLRALVDIGFWAPRWATTDPGPRARANIDPQAYADYATAVALRYSGAFTPPADPPDVAAPAADARPVDHPVAPAAVRPVPGARPARCHPAAERAPDAAPAAAGRAARRRQRCRRRAGATGKLPAVDGFILWNEPNHQGLLLPQWEADKTTPASPRVYRAMLRAGYAAVKAVRKKAKVLVGNTSSTGGTRGAGPVPPLEFLRDLACVDRNLKPKTTPECANFAPLPGDGWAHHPYSQNERPSRVSQARDRARRPAHGRPARSSRPRSTSS